MKQYLIINNKLKMSNGKIVRLGISAGTSVPKLLSSSLRKWRWIVDGMVAIVLKTDDFEAVLSWLEENKIKNQVHIDLGLTQVPKGSKCSVTFFYEGDDPFLKNLKLY